MNGKSKSWFDIYNDQIKRESPIRYLDRRVKEKKVLIENIIGNTPKKGRILEAGCGAATISSYLSNLGYDVTALDINSDILGLAKYLSKNLERQPNFVIGDIKYLKFAKDSFDTSFSNGVLEHFQDEEIKNIIRLQVSCCNRVIFSIPSKFFREDEKIYGDERFLTKGKWRELAKESGAEIIKEFGFSYKESNSLENLYIWSRSIFGGIKPYIGFVIKNK